MPTEPELLQAVLAKPDDDAPRLEYAKWCETRPDRPTVERAEFIRGQLTLGTRAEHDRSIETRRLQDRTLALLRQHAATWSRTLGPQVARAGFTRGFPESVEVNATQAAQLLPELQRAAPIRHLDLVGPRDAVAAFFASPALKGIRSLKAEGLELDDAAVAQLANNPGATSLRWLSLAHNRLGFEASRSLVASPFLRDLVYVEMFGNPVDPVDRYGQDDDNVVGAWQPPEGKLLENWHGIVPWLHRTATTVSQLVPDRFRLR